MSRAAQGAHRALRPDEVWVDGPAIRRARTSRGLVAKWVAERAEISPQFLSNIEKGWRQCSPADLRAIAAAMGVPWRELTVAKKASA